MPVDHEKIFDLERAISWELSRAQYCLMERDLTWRAINHIKCAAGLVAELEAETSMDKIMEPHNASR